MPELKPVAWRYRAGGRWNYVQRRPTTALLMPEPLFADCAARYFDQHMLLIAATRYALGRQTYVVGDICDGLVRAWPLIPEQTRAVLRRDIEEAFQRDDEARAEGATCRALGMDCDRAQWERVRALFDERKEVGNV
ncbi:hypothetical protein D9M69_470750 [compost metagenome]